MQGEGGEGVDRCASSEQMRARACCGRPPVATGTLPVPLQIEIDFKTECQAGATVVPLCQPLAGPSPASACSPAPRAPRHLLHSLRRCEGGARGSHQQELVRCRTVWLPTLDGLMLE